MHGETMKLVHVINTCLETLKHGVDETHVQNEVQDKPISRK
jgi:hypothetical protein